MVNLSKRQKQLAKELLMQTGSRTVEEYAKKLHVSTRTIHSDLQKVAIYLDNIGCELIKKPGIGIELVKNQNKPLPHTKIETELLFGPAERQQAIMQQLLFKHNNASYQQLADLFYVSKSSIKADLKEVCEQYLQDNTVKLISDNLGTRLIGTEKEMQQTLVGYNEIYFQEHINVYDDGVKRHKFYCKQYGEPIVNYCYQILSEFDQITINEIPTHYLYNLQNIFIVLVYRISLRYHIEDETDVFLFNKVQNLPFQVVLRELLIANQFAGELVYTDGDIAYLSQQLKANKIELNYCEPDGDENKILITNIIQKMSRLMEVDLDTDDILFQQLQSHFVSMLYRLQNNIHITNPLLTQIKEEFKVMFDITWFVMENELSKLGIQLIEEEMALIIIYFQAAMERNKYSKKVLIVCPMGISTSQLVANKIRQILPPLDIIETTSLKKMLENDLRNIDFIISTVPLQEMNKLTVIVSPLMNDDDVKNISDFYNEQFVFKEELSIKDKLTFPYLQQYIEEDLIIVEKTKQTRNQILEKVSNKLVQKKYVEHDYVESLYHREKLGGTALATGIATPHGNPSMVNKTNIVIYVNETTVKWQPHVVKIALFLNFAEIDLKNARKILEDINKIIRDKEVIEYLFFNKTNQEIFNSIGGEKHDL